MMDAIRFIRENWQQILELLQQHLILMGASLGIAIAIALPLGTWAAKDRRVARTFLPLANVLQAIPSIAVIGAVVPLFGIGFGPALAALTVRGILPVYLNTQLGVAGVDPAIREAALGTGLRTHQSLLWVELPLAIPVIMAGLRTAAVESVGIATLAAFIGAGGLGDLILQGIAMMDSARLLGGAIPVALLAIAIEVTSFGAELVLRRRFNPANQNG